MLRPALGSWIVLAPLLACGGGSDDPSPTGGSGAAGAGSGAPIGTSGSSSVVGGAGVTTAGGTGGLGSPPASGRAAAGTGGAPAGVADSPAAACIAYLRGWCERRERCNPIARDDAERDALLRGCIAETGPKCPDYFFSPGAARTVEGTFACADEWRDFECDAAEVFGLAPACALPGTRQTGEPCLFGSQCASQICSGGNETCGVCRARAAPGEPCDDTVTYCARGHTCTGDPMTCQPIPREDPVPVPPIPGLGEECDPSVGCGGAQVADCDADPADGVYRCVPWPVLGEDCSDPGVKTCLLGNSYCDIGGTCLAFPGTGEPCGVDGWTGQPSWCAPGHTCSAGGDPRTCERFPSAGSVCEFGCSEGFDCACTDEVCGTRRCVRHRLPGESCTELGDQCIRNATRCEGGVCVAVETQGLFEQTCAM